MRSPLRSLPNKRRLPSKRKQKGAVAVVVGLSLVTLFAMGGVVLDLGHLYIAKSELQNSADAAALAGARRLDETDTGITNARNDAIAIAGQNKFNFSTNVVISTTNVEYGPSPTGPWSDYGTAFASPKGKTFVKVDTGARVLDTYLMRVVAPAYNTISTAGDAVAGRFVNNITPIGVCAVDPANKTSKFKYDSGLTELMEFGFRRGVSYDIFAMNPLGGSSVPYLINAAESPPTPCVTSHNNADFAKPFICGGNSTVIPSGVGKVYTNTGLEAALAKSLNSRFGDYDSAGKCIPAKAPPDKNIKEYPFGATPVTSWMATGGATQQSVHINPKEPPPANLLFNTEVPTRKPNYDWEVLDSPAQTPPWKIPSPSTASGTAYAQFADSARNYGVLWSYGPAYQADTDTTPGLGAPFTVAQANANKLYSTAIATYFDGSYPSTAGAGFPSGTPAAPYNQTDSAYFTSGGANGVRNRRILNLVLVDCRTAPVGPANCASMDAVGVGRFFMPTRADTSSFSRLDLEFAGLITPVPKSEIKLYK